MLMISTAFVQTETQDITIQYLLKYLGAYNIIFNRDRKYNLTQKINLSVFSLQLVKYGLHIISQQGLYCFD